MWTFLLALFVSSTAWLSSHHHPERETRQDGGQEGRSRRPWSQAETLLATVAAGFPSFHGGLGARTLTGPLNNERNVWAAPAPAAALTLSLSAFFFLRTFYDLCSHLQHPTVRHTLIDVKTGTDRIYGWSGCLGRQLQKGRRTNR